MWINPSGYVAGAVLAGAISGGGLGGARSAALLVLALWVVLDMCMGTLTRSIRLLLRSPRASTRRGRAWRQVPAIFVSLIAGGALTCLMPNPVRMVIGGATLLSVLMAVATFRRPVTRLSALQVSVSVLAAWTGAYLLLAGQAQPTIWLGILAGAGTGARLWHGFDQRTWSLWVARLSWAGLLGAVVLARQPLLAGLVAITACADDLYRRQPVRR
ncbi:MAG: hypothetical protein ACYCYF_08660, partial [Anaerolineae bacterium]